MSVDVTDETFETAVIERSKTVPVVVDLWAPWCGPCRQLGPILEEVIDATNGAVELAKVNVDDNPQVSQAFKVQGIPAVFGLIDGQVAAHFVGAKPHREVAEFVASLLPSATETEIDSLVALGDEDSLRAALELVHDHQIATEALAALLIATQRNDEALELLTRVPETPETRRLAAAARTGDVADGDAVEVELERLLEQVKADDDARQAFVDLLDRLGPEDPRTAEYRRRLTAKLY